MDGGAWKTVKFYIKRYYIAEIISFFASYFAFIIASSAFRNDVVSAYFGTCGAFVGFYTPIAVSEWRSIPTPRSVGAWKQILIIIKNLAIEFGLSELLDFLLIRPFCLYSASNLISYETIAVIAGNQTANITFFSIAALMHRCNNQAEKAKHKKGS